MLELYLFKFYQWAIAGFSADALPVQIQKVTNCAQYTTQPSRYDLQTYRNDSVLIASPVSSLY